LHHIKILREYIQSSNILRPRADRHIDFFVVPFIGGWDILLPPSLRGDNWRVGGRSQIHLWVVLAVLSDWVCLHVWSEEIELLAENRFVRKRVKSLPFLLRRLIIVLINLNSLGFFVRNECLQSNSLIIFGNSLDKRDRLFNLPGFLLVFDHPVLVLQMESLIYRVVLVVTSLALRILKKTQSLRALEVVFRHQCVPLEIWSMILLIPQPLRSIGRLNPLFHMVAPLRFNSWMNPGLYPKPVAILEIALLQILHLLLLYQLLLTLILHHRFQSVIERVLSHLKDICPVRAPIVLVRDCRLVFVEFRD
jgi:hypothetical protein